MVFVRLIAALQEQGVLKRLGLTAVLCASTTTEYAGAYADAFLCRTFSGQALKARLCAAGVKAAFLEAAGVHGVLEESFLGPAQLSVIFARTRLNVHPCAYDAFGMTIVEAASQGAPSLVHHVRCVERGGTVLNTRLTPAPAGRHGGRHGAAQRGPPRVPGSRPAPARRRAGT